MTLWRWPRRSASTTCCPGARAAHVMFSCFDSMPCVPACHSRQVRQRCLLIAPGPLCCCKPLAGQCSYTLLWLQHWQAWSCCIKSYKALSERPLVTEVVGAIIWLRLATKCNVRSTGLLVLLLPPWSGLALRQ